MPGEEAVVRVEIDDDALKRIDKNEAAGLLEGFAAEELGEEIESEADAATDDRGETDDSEEETEELESESEESEEAESDETEAETEETTEEPVYTVTIDGQPHQVTLQEALQGYQRQADYTRKTQSLADERREFEAEKAENRRIRDQYRERLDLLGKALQTEEPDWDKVREEKPDDYPRLYADWARKRAQHDKVEAEQNRIQEEQRRDAERDYKQHVESERQKLYAKIPEWSKDEGVADQERQAMAEHARAMGFTPEEIAAAADHRTMLLLRDSMLYRRLTAEKVTAKPKAEKVLKPGAKKAAKPKKSEGVKAYERLRKTGRSEDAQDVFMEMLEEDFK